MSEESIKLRYKRKKLRILANDEVKEGEVLPVGFTLAFVKTAKVLTEGALPYYADKADAG